MWSRRASVVPDRRQDPGSSGGGRRPLHRRPRRRAGCVWRAQARRLHGSDPTPQALGSLRSDAGGVEPARAGVGGGRGFRRQALGVPPAPEVHGGPGAPGAGAGRARGAVLRDHAGRDRGVPRSRRLAGGEPAAASAGRRCGRTWGRTRRRPRGQRRRGAGQVARLVGASPSRAGGRDGGKAGGGDRPLSAGCGRVAGTAARRGAGLPAGRRAREGAGGQRVAGGRRRGDGDGPGVGRRNGLAGAGPGQCGSRHELAPRQGARGEGGLPGVAVRGAQSNAVDASGAWRRRSGPGCHACRREAGAAQSGGDRQAADVGRGREGRSGVRVGGEGTAALRGRDPGQGRALGGQVGEAAEAGREVAVGPRREVDRRGGGPGGRRCG